MRCPWEGLNNKSKESDVDMLLKLAGLPRRLYFGAAIINRNGPFPSAGAYLCTWVGLPIPLQSRRTIPISRLVR